MKKIFIASIFIILCTLSGNASVVLLTTGYKNIDSVQVGDSVIAYDQYDGHVIVNVVLEKSLQRKPKFIADGETFNFYLINGTWNLFRNQSIWFNGNVTHAYLLQVGDTIYDDNDQDVVITSIVENTADTVWCKFEISGDHSYIVDGLTLHNASRYWAGGGSSANWNATGNTNWSGTSGGANNASVPTSSDNVFFTGVGSGASNSTLSANITISSLDFTGYVNTLTHNAGVAWSINGSTFKLSSGMTYTLVNSQTSFSKFFGNNITTNGKILGDIQVRGFSSTTTLLDNLTSSGKITHIETTVFNTNGMAVQALYFEGYNTGSGGGTLTLGSTIMTLTGDDASGGTTTFSAGVVVTTTGYVISANTATIKFISTANAQTLSIHSNVANHPVNIWRTGSGAGGFDFFPSTGRTFTSLKDDGTVAHTWRFINSSTTTLSSAGGWLLNGSAGQLLSLTTTTGATYCTISVASGTVTANYVSLKDNHATGGATFNATNGTDVSGNTGWIFPVTATNAGFFMLMCR